MRKALISVFLVAAFCLAVRLAALTGSAKEGPGKLVKETPEDAAQKIPKRMEAPQAAYKLSPEQYQKAVAYSRAKYWLHFLGVAYGLLLLLRVLGWRIAPRLRNWAEAVSKRRFVQALIFTPLLFLTLDVLTLPLDLYRQHLARHYDQSVQGWGSWLWDWTKGELIAFVLGGLLIWILYALIRRSPRRWWLYSWLVSLPILVFLQFINPVVIEPLFFKFEPLEAKQPALVTEIEKVVARGGLSIPRERMFEMKASEKLKSIGAYVTGIGASQRVVVWDTTSAKTSIPQTLFVFGHEMGHYVLGHILKSMALMAGLLLVLLWLGYHSMRWAVGRWGERWAIRGMDDWASLPVLLLLFSLFGFLAEPAVNSFSRWQEREADIYGLEVTHGIVPNASEAAAGAFQVLGQINLADPNPNPLIEFWLYSHPALGERLVFAQQYDPWSKGQPPKYVR